MTRYAAARKGYVRPMQGWWRRDPFFMRYMIREVTAFAVLAYAIVLVVGAVRLSQGEVAWNGYLAALRSPGSILFHVLLLVSMVEHARSWFEIMPKTMPMMHVGGERLAGETITRTGWIASAVATVLVIAIAWWLKS